jgi:integrase
MRFERDGKSHFLGLGSYASLPQAKAEALVARYMSVVRAGGDPYESRDADRAAAGEPMRRSSTAKRSMTFRQAAYAYIDQFESTWTEAHAMQWRQTMRDYAVPLIGDQPVKSVDVDRVIQVLEPLWRTKSTTAVKMRTRIRKVLDWAMAMGYRPDGENPANSKAIDIRLGAAHHTVHHREAIPVSEMQSFWRLLAQEDSVRADATRFMILTATRASETLGADWSEVEIGERLWVIPASRMKTPRPHRVPMSTGAMAVLQRRAGTGLIFPNDHGARMHRSVPKALIQRLRGTRETAHGCRSTFAVWCQDVAHVDPMVREAALAHRLGDATVVAYARSDLLQRRAEVMERWAQWLTGKDGSVD